MGGGGGVFYWRTESHTDEHRLTVLPLKNSKPITNSKIPFRNLPWMAGPDPLLQLPSCDVVSPPGYLDLGQHLSAVLPAVGTHALPTLEVC